MRALQHTPYTRVVLVPASKDYPFSAVPLRRLNADLYSFPDLSVLSNAARENSSSSGTQANKINAFSHGASPPANVVKAANVCLNDSTFSIVVIILLFILSSLMSYVHRMIDFYCSME